MRARELLFGATGAVATALGIGLLVAPSFVTGIGPLDGLVEAVAAADPTLLMLAAGLTVGGYVVLAARSRPTPETAPTRTDAERRFRTAGDSPPEAVTAGRRTVAAEPLDNGIEAAVEGGGEDLAAVRRELATVAAETYAMTTGSDVETGTEAVANGTWTDDQVAAMFLSERRRPRPTARARIALWLRPHRERRQRIERTIAAIERLEVRG